MLLLDYSSDAVTAAASLHSLEMKKAFKWLSIGEKYAESIDMTNAKAGTPSYGATDVCPFVPVKDITTASRYVELLIKWPNASIVN